MTRLMQLSLNMKFRMQSLLEDKSSATLSRALRHEVLKGTLSMAVHIPAKAHVKDALILVSGMADVCALHSLTAGEHLEREAAKHVLKVVCGRIMVVVKKV